MSSLSLEESRDVSVSRDRPEAISVETSTGLRSTAGHPVPLADSLPYQSPRRSSFGMSPSSFRILKERSLKNLTKPGVSRERSASWSHYSAPLLSTSGIMPPMSPFRNHCSTLSAETCSPFIPNLGPPTISTSKAAMDAAMTLERKRMKEKELEEKNMSAEELTSVLRRERIRMSRMAADLAVLKSNAVQSQAEAEVNEEGRINCLLAHLDGLQQEKGRIIVELEREEEMVRNIATYLVPREKSVLSFLAYCTITQTILMAFATNFIADKHFAKETEQSETRKRTAGAAN